MMELKSHLLHLESWAREELAAQRRIMEHVVSQEDALRINDRTAFEDATAAIQREAEAGLERNARRDRIVNGIADHYGVAGRHMTLSSVIERAGDEAGELPDLRGGLKEATGDVARRTRRLKRVMGVLRDLNREVLGTVLGDQGTQALETEGALVDAEA